VIFIKKTVPKNGQRLSEEKIYSCKCVFRLAIEWGGVYNAARLRAVAEPNQNAPTPNSVSQMNQLRRDLSRRLRCGHSEVCIGF